MIHELALKGFAAALFGLVPGVLVVLSPLSACANSLNNKAKPAIPKTRKLQQAGSSPAAIDKSKGSDEVNKFTNTIFADKAQTTRVLERLAKSDKNYFRAKDWNKSDEAAMRIRLSKIMKRYPGLFALSGELTFLRISGSKNINIGRKFFRIVPGYIVCDDAQSHELKYTTWLVSDLAEIANFGRYYSNRPEWVEFVSSHFKQPDNARYLSWDAANYSNAPWSYRNEREIRFKNEFMAKFMKTPSPTMCKYNRTMIAGGRAEAEGNYVSAIYAYKKASELFPQTPYPFHRMIRCYLHATCVEDAFEASTKALKLYRAAWVPENECSYLHLLLERGYLFYYQEKRSESESIADRIIMKSRYYPPLSEAAQKLKKLNKELPNKKPEELLL